MKQQNRRRGIVASVGALVTAAALALGGAAAAQAAPTIPPTFTTANLNITKQSTPANGTVAWDNTTAGLGSPVQGVVFSVQQVNVVDLSTNAGWVTASKLTFNAAAGTVAGTGTNGQPVALGTAAYGKTDASGKPQISDPAGNITGGPAFQGLPIGVYLVKEILTPAGVTPSQPFMVTLPITDPVNRSTWSQEVNVWPKNSVVAATKSIKDATPFTDSGAVTPNVQDVAWTVSADVPRVADPDNANQYLVPTGFKISDDLNAALTLRSGSVVLKITSPPSTEAPLNEGTGNDYVLTSTGAAGEDFNVTFLPAGLAKLQAAAATAGSKVVMEFITDVSTTATGTIDNVAKVFPAQASIDSTNPAGPTQQWIDTTGAPVTKWDNISFTKVKKDETTVVPDAKFKLFLNQTDARAGTNPIRTSAVTSTSAGIVDFTGLRVSDFANNAAQSAGIESVTNSGTYDTVNPNYIVYWLTETEAPTGYELLANPIPVVLMSTGAVMKIAVDSNGNPLFSSTTGAVTELGALDNIINVEKNAGFVLPLTGGMGTAFLTVIGVGILGFVVFMARRRRSEEAAN